MNKREEKKPDWGSLFIAIIACILMTLVMMATGSIDRENAESYERFSNCYVKGVNRCIEDQP